MWFEILPSMLTIAVCMGIPHGVAYVAHKAVWGNPYRRTLKLPQDRRRWHRDESITGNAYKIRGLEAIKD